MTTTAELIDETIALMQSWSVDQPQLSTLVSSINFNDVTFTYSPSTAALGLSPGVVEIDKELIYVSAVDGSIATIPPWGRGFKSTTAVGHAGNSKITSQPVFPRQKVLDAINQVLGRIFPDLFAVKSYETTTTLPIITYDVPDDCQRILKIKWMRPDGRYEWENVRRWRVSAGGGTQFGDGLNGITVDIADLMMPGRPIQFLYAAKPTPLVNETDVFTTTSGLNDNYTDLIECGVAAQMLTALEASRTQVTSIEQQNRAQQIGPGAALTASRYLEARYQQRLKEEKQTLQTLYPPRITREWV